MLLKFIALALLPIHETIAEAAVVLGHRPPPSKTAKETRITPSSVVGAGQRGALFDDKGAMVGDDHKRLMLIYLYGCRPGEHLTQIWVGYGLDNQILRGEYHGSAADPDDHESLDLYDGDRVIKVELATYKKRTGMTYKTRVGYIKLYTKQGKTLACGAKKPEDHVETWYTYGKSLLYFSGTSGDAVDSLQGHFIPSEDYY